MKKAIHSFLIPCFIFLLSCGNTTADKNKTTSSVDEKVSGASNSSGDGLVGKWKEEYFTSDNNGNYQLDEDEKKVAKQPVIDVFLNLNADGSCSLTSWTEKGHYKVTENENRKKISIHDDPSNEDNNFALASVDKSQLVLVNYSSGFIHVYKRQ